MINYDNAVYNCLNRLVPIKMRFKIIERLNNNYFKEYEKVLPVALINLLSAWCVKEFYMDKSSNKVAMAEHPFLSRHQYKRRTDREVHTTDIETMEILKFHKNNNTLQRNKKGALADA